MSIQNGLLDLWDKEGKGPKTQRVKDITRDGSIHYGGDLGGALFQNAIAHKFKENIGGFTDEELQDANDFMGNFQWSQNQVFDDIKVEQEKRGSVKAKNALEAKRKDRFARLEKAEAGLTEGLVGAQRATEDAIGNQLTQLLQETGLAANVARQQVGGQYAEAGLSRSTFAQEGVEGITSSELDRKGAQRLAASEQISSVRRTTDQANFDMQRKRERAREAIELDQEQAFNDHIQSLEKEQINRFYSTATQQYGMQQQDAAYMAELTGGVFAGAGQLFGSYVGGKQTDKAVMVPNTPSQATWVKE
jgi:hypothetical protein